MAVVDNPPARWYPARIIGPANISEIADLEPADLVQVQQATRQAVAQLLPSALDIYLTARIGGAYGSVRITNIALGTQGLSLGLPAPGSTSEGVEVAMVVWVGEDGDQPHAYDPNGPTLPLTLSGAIAAQAVRHALGSERRTFDLGEYGRIAWTPATVEITHGAGMPGPLLHTASFDYNAAALGNYRSTMDPSYAVWLWFTDSATGRAEKTPYLLTPELDDPGDPPRPPLLAVETIDRLRAWTGAAE